MDTLYLVKKLKQAGISEQQAEAHVEILSETFQKIHNNDSVATKGDLTLLRNDILQFKIDLIKWVVGMAVAQIAILIALTQLF